MAQRVSLWFPFKATLFGVGLKGSKGKPPILRVPLETNPALICIAVTLVDISPVGIHVH